MEFKNLLTFKKIAEYKSFSKTAVALGYAQSTITFQIKQLEDELGIKLFDRLGNHIFLTDEGIKLLDYANRIIALSDEAVDSICPNTIPTGTLRICSMNSLCANILPFFIKQFQMNFPSVNIVATTGTYENILSNLKNGIADMALILTFDIPPKEFITTYSNAIPLYFVCAKTSPLAKKKKVTIFDLKDIPLIVPEYDCCYRNLIMQLFHKWDLEPLIYFETENTEAVKHFVENDIGIALLPELAVHEELNEQKLKRIPIDTTIPPINIKLLYHKNKCVTPAMQEFSKLISKL